jgi:catecholate siderophore receptor
MALSSLQAVFGLRFDDFNVDFTTTVQRGFRPRRERFASARRHPQAVVLPIHGSYRCHFFPGGEQLSSLSLTNTLEPESFRNYEIGAKWDFLRNGSFTVAVYDLERGNVLVTDPNDPTVSFLVDGQRTRGVEISVDGRLTERWDVLVAYAYQDGKITRSLSATAASGATLANLPKNSFSLWNRYQVSPRIGVGAGLIYRGDIFASTDNTVVLPGYFRGMSLLISTRGSRSR